MRADIYARFSTDTHSVASIEDQARISRKRANALGLRFTGEGAGVLNNELYVGRSV